MSSRYPSKKNLDPNSPTNKWAKALLEDEVAGLKTMKIKISTHKAIQELSSQRSGSTYDDIILAALDSYKREQEDKGYDPLSAIANDTNEETEEED